MNKLFKIISIFVFSILLILLLAACQPSEEQIANAIAMTQTAIIKQTPIATNTPEPSITPTSDSRIIEGDPQDFLIKKDDLPKEYKYYLPSNSWIGRTSNNEIVNSSNRGVEASQQYISETGRIDGWWVHYRKGTELVKGPYEIGCSLTNFETSSGALLSLNKYNNVFEIPTLSEYTYTKGEDVFSDLGNNYYDYYREFYGSDGAKWLEYYIDVAYHNWWFECFGYGPKEQVDPTIVATITKIQLEKLATSSSMLP